MHYAIDALKRSDQSFGARQIRRDNLDPLRADRGEVVSHWRTMDHQALSDRFGQQPPREAAAKISRGAGDENRRQKNRRYFQVGFFSTSNFT